MNELLADPRRRTLLLLGGAASAAGVLAGLSMLPAATTSARAEIGQRVAPDLESLIPELGLIMVTTAHESYHLVRNPDGWALTEKGGYPVSDAMVLRLATAVSGMSFNEPMTRDQRKFDLIGLGDPLAGGTGALLELGDGRGNVFSKLIIGYRSGRSYVRRPDDLQTWAVDATDMPPLHRATAWLDLDPVKAARSEIAEVSVQPVVGQGYTLLADAGEGQSFSLAPPDDRLSVLVPLSLTMIGNAMATLRPIDVFPAMNAGPAGRAGAHRTTLKDGVNIDATVWRSDERGWITITARADASAAQSARSRADEINQAATGWAYVLSDADWEAFAAPLALFAVEG